MLVLVCASLGSWLAYRHFLAPPRGQFEGISVSPDGRWHLAVYYISFNAGALSAGGDGLWRVVVQQHGVAVLRERCVYLDYAPSDPWSASIRWNGDRVATIAGQRVDVPSANVHDNKPFSEAQYNFRWAEIVVNVLLLWVVGLVAVSLLALRRQRDRRQRLTGAPIP